MRRGCARSACAAATTWSRSEPSAQRAGFKPSLNLLYSLEGALLDCHWQELSEPQREALVQDYEARIAAHPLKAAGPASGPVHEQRFDADDDAEDSVAEGADED